MDDRDVGKEKEIENYTDVATLKRIRGSRKGQLTKAQHDLVKYRHMSLGELRKHTLETLVITYERQAHSLAQDRILSLLRTVLNGEVAYEEEESEGEAQDDANEQIRAGIQELMRALDASYKAKSMQRTPDMFKNSDSFDMKEQLKQMEVTTHELLVTDAELPDMNELSAQISELQLEHRKFTKKFSELLRLFPLW